MTYLNQRLLNAPPVNKTFLTTYLPWYSGLDLIIYFEYHVRPKYSRKWPYLLGDLAGVAASEPTGDLKLAYWLIDNVNSIKLPQEKNSSECAWANLGVTFLRRQVDWLCWVNLYGDHIPDGNEYRANLTKAMKSGKEGMLLFEELFERDHPVRQFDFIVDTHIHAEIRQCKS